VMIIMQIWNVITIGATLFLIHSLGLLLYRL